MLRVRFGHLRALAQGDGDIRLVDTHADPTAAGVAVVAGQSAVLRGHEGRVYAVGTSSGGELFVSASGDATVRLWDVETGACRPPLRGHSDAVMATCMSQNDRLLATASWDKTVRLWRMPGGTDSTILNGHSGWVSSVCFRPDSAMLASSSADGTLLLWDIPTGRRVATLQVRNCTMYSVCFSPDGRTLASGSSDELVRIWDLASGTCRTMFSDHTSDVRSVSFAANGTLLASGSNDKTVRVWNLRATSGRSATLLGQHDGKVYSVCFSPSGQYVLSCSADKTVRMWDAERRAEVLTLTGHSGEVNAVGMLTDGSAIVSGSDDKTVRIWELVRGRSAGTLVGHCGSISAMAFSADGARFASASLEDCTARLWRVDTCEGDVPRSIDSHNDLAVMLRRLLLNDDAAPVADTPPAEPHTPAAAPRPVPDAVQSDALDWSQVQRSTAGLAADRVIGRGAFGVVYRGTYESAPVAVKVLDLGRRQGVREFEAEVATLSKLRHPNIIRLVGHAYGVQGKRALIYELAANGSARDQLDGGRGTSALTLAQRRRIMADIACGMIYLQTAFERQPIFHLDLKSTNVLLDARMGAKISDFGMNMIVPAAAGAGSDAALQPIRGTLGYICPEYRDQGRVCHTTDVYSYGIVLMELLTGRQPDGNDLCTLVRCALQPPRRSLSSLLDARLAPITGAQAAEADVLGRLAVRCAALSRLERPSFREIQRELQGAPAGSGETDRLSAAQYALTHECVLCMDAPANTQLQPCRHSALCRACADRLLAERPQCPVCRRAVARVDVGVFYRTFDNG